MVYFGFRFKQILILIAKIMIKIHIFEMMLNFDQLIYLMNKLILNILRVFTHLFKNIFFSAF